MYYRDGAPHRLDGPANAEHYADGLWAEEYYRDGKRHREDGPQFALRRANGSGVEEYYRDGKPDRKDGPAIIERGADGSVVERYYREGKLLEIVRLFAITAIPGVSLTRITPNPAPPRPAP